MVLFLLKAVDIKVDIKVVIFSHSAKEVFPVGNCKVLNKICNICKKILI